MHAVHPVADVVRDVEGLLGGAVGRLQRGPLPRVVGVDRGALVPTWALPEVDDLQPASGARELSSSRGRKERSTSVTTSWSRASAEAQANDLPPSEPRPGPQANAESRMRTVTAPPHADESAEVRTR